MKPRSYWNSIPFRDGKKFPYGFSRSGIFSLSESATLELKGTLFNALLEERVFDPSAEDLMFVKAIRSGNFELNNDTQIWAKYMFHQRRIISISGGWTATEPATETLIINEFKQESGSANDWEFDSTSTDDEFLQAS